MTPSSSDQARSKHDERILAALAQRDRQSAASLLLIEHGTAIGREGMALLGSHEEAEDLLQETLLAVLDGSEVFGGSGSVGDWLLGVARQRAARRLEARARAGEDEPEDFDIPSTLLERLAKAPAVESGQRPQTAPAPPPETPRESGLSLQAKRWALPLLAAVAAVAVVAGRAKETGTSADDPELVGPPWRGRVSKLLASAGKLEICAPNGSACHEAREGDEIPSGSRLRTDRGVLAELAFSDGSQLSLDRSTTLKLSSRGRGGELLNGGVVADVAQHERWSARFEFKSGHLDVLGTKFSLRSDDDAATVHVARGRVRLADAEGHDAVVVAGEEGRVAIGARPTASPSAALGEALGWSEAVQQEPDSEVEPRPRALGELKAKKPGERDERSNAVRLESHAVRVKIAGSMARTEVEEVFTNQTDDVLEGIFRFPLPSDAKLERLALEVDGKLEEGAFVDRERASAIWRGAIVNAAPQLRHEIKDEIVWVPGPWRDPALLEWQRGGRFELRIYPIPRRGSRRVILAYSQLVKQAASVRHYSYPLGFDPSGNARAVDLSLDVQLRGADPAFRTRTPGWDVSRVNEDGVEHLHYEARGFTPNGDFGLDYAVPERDTELSAWAYRDPSTTGQLGAPYVALALRPRLPSAHERGPGRAVALVVDASRSVFGESYRRATSLATRLARDLDSADRLTVLACDTTCRELPGELRTPGPQAARDVRRFLEHETPGGASDIALAVTRGFAALRDSGRAPHVLYLGDGTATVGPTRPATLERAVRASIPADGRVTALGIGPESDADSLFALARGGRGTALPYVPGQPLGDAALSALSSVYGAALSDVELELPEGISQVAPARLDPIVAGSELIVTGRLDRGAVKGEAVLRGTLNGRAFEQRYPLDVAPSESSGNAFVQQLFAAARIADLERDGSDSAKREAVALSTQLGVASRYTSLLVLESEAMYKAFGLESGHKTAEYTADLDAEGSSSNGELALSEEDADAKAKEERVGALDQSMNRAAPAAPAAPRAMRAYDRYTGPADAAESPALDSLGRSGVSSGGAARKPAFAPPPPLPSPSAPALEARAPEKKRVSTPDDEDLVLEPLPRPRGRTMIPMRRIWERKGEIFTDRFVPRAASGSALTDAERELSRDDSRRQNLKRAFALSSVSGDLSEAARLAERWIEKEPLDAEALTALADVAARRGERDSAIRLLGSVLDVRPGDSASHLRLARLERWAGHPELACRHSIAIAEGKSQDLARVADAVRCARVNGMTEIADALLAAATDTARASIEEKLAQPAADEAALSGDLRLEASWSGSVDLDVSLLDTEGHRVSWLGAGTRAVISARDVTSTSREGLALRGAAPGEYVVELTRGAGAGSAQGEVSINLAGSTRRVPFNFDGERKVIALLRVSMQPRLVPL